MTSVTATFVGTEAQSSDYAPLLKWILVNVLAAIGILGLWYFGLIQTVLDGQPGERNARLNWAAWKAREHIMAGRFDSHTAVGALTMAAEQVGLPEQEALRTIASGLGVKW